MKTLSEIKNGIAYNRGYLSWENLLSGERYSEGYYIEEIAIAYATEALKEAAKKGRLSRIKLDILDLINELK